MNKRELAILEKAYALEIDSALSESKLPPLLQTSSKLAAKLAADGLLQMSTAALEGFPRVVIKGYMLTEAGRMAYCMNCEEGA